MGHRKAIILELSAGLLVLAPLFVACADNEGGGGVDAGSDADTGTDAGTDGGTDADVCSGDGLWYDGASGLCWQDPLAGGTSNWQDAMDHCDGLSLGGFDDWRLPTISELRSLIRGCPGTETGGSCGLTDECLDPGCGTGCVSCVPEAGPGANGCYWDAGLAALESGSWNTWSSSTRPDHATLVYCVQYGNAAITSCLKSSNDGLARCVRGGP